MAYVVLDFSLFMVIKAFEFITLKENKNFHTQYKVHAQYFLVADTLDSILLIELRRNGIDKQTGTKCFISGRRAHEILEATFEDS